MSSDEMTPYERLMAEAIPTGTFGGARPPKPRRPAAATAPPWTPEQQAQHVATLLEELDGWEWHDDYADAKRERDQERYQRERAPLRLITNDPANDESAA
jgi:hypothetical protein